MKRNFLAVAAFIPWSLLGCANVEDLPSDSSSSGGTGMGGGTTGSGGFGTGGSSSGGSSTGGSSSGGSSTGGASTGGSSTGGSSTGGSSTGGAGTGGSSEPYEPRDDCLVMNCDGTDPDPKAEEYPCYEVTFSTNTNWQLFNDLGCTITFDGQTVTAGQKPSSDGVHQIAATGCTYSYAEFDCYGNN